VTGLYSRSLDLIQKARGVGFGGSAGLLPGPFGLADFADSYGGFEAEGHQSLGGDADGFASGCALGDGSGTGSREGSDGGSFASAG
jgi:hypothetical protein